LAFEIIPAIDLLERRVVRLSRGKRDQCTVYSDDPVAFARAFEEAGATRLHVVDLDGAFSGELGNLDLVGEIARATSMRVELGGGIRSRAAAETAFGAGVHDVILGTKAIEDHALVSDLLKHFPGRVIMGVDAKDGYVAIKGWVETAQTTATDLAKALFDLGARRIIYTDIATDGLLTGPNIPAMRAMADAVPGMELVASGGVSRVEDLHALLDAGIPSLVGAITGRAIYEGRLDLASAVQSLKARMT